jgi:hypothetical protein
MRTPAVRDRWAPMQVSRLLAALASLTPSAAIGFFPKCNLHPPAQMLLMHPVTGRRST